MKIDVNGNSFRFVIEEKDINTTVTYTFPDGYSFNKIIFSRYTTELYLILPQISSYYNSKLTFPIVKSKSPNTIVIAVTDKANAGNYMDVYITKFGGIPDSHYFDKAFDPVLVKSKDENGNEIEYIMIPSTQFER